MISPPDPPLSLLRARLSSLENALAVAARLREERAIPHYVLSTDDPFRPYRVTTTRPTVPGQWSAMVA